MPRVRLPIETDRLRIRALLIEDADALHELYSDGEAMSFLESAVPTTVAESRAWVQSKIDRFERDEGMSLWPSNAPPASSSATWDCNGRTTTASASSISAAG